MNIAISDFNIICRICLQNRNDISVLLTTEIKCMIETCTSVQKNYIDNKMPQQICSECYDELKDAYQFRQKYIQSTQTLTEIILKTEIQTDNEENDVKRKSNCNFDSSDKQGFTLCINEDNSDNFDDTKTQLGSDIENYLNKKVKKSSVKLKKRLRVKKNKTRQKDLFNNIDYTCDICGKKFRTRRYLNVHKITHAKGRPHACSMCHRTFKHKSSLRGHVRVKHKYPDRREICFICGKIFFPGSFNYHLSTHERARTDEKYKCNICARAYTHEQFLRKHYQDKHTDAVNIRFYCDICNKGYPTNGSLKKHKTYTHSDEKKFKCEYCDKNFKTISQINAHVNSIHKNLRPHTCSTCNKAFHTTTKLRRHMICHTGERPFMCEICGKSFGRKCILKRHEKKLHSK